jgi:hypothetical protein
MGRNTRRGIVIIGLLAALILASPRPDYLDAERKIEMIRREIVPAGSRVTIGKAELNAYVRKEVTQVAPQGVRNARLELGNNRATAFADIDFVKLQRSQGRSMSWLVEKLLEGERPVRVDARIRSSGGQAIVDVDRVVISGVTISGDALDYLIRNFLWAYYPEAKVGKPFDLDHNIDRLEVSPAEVRVVIAGR